ncbi:hypothetical protein [Aequorivita lipolytica]|uniref:Uncharacterized protein n=1 Tax=Aequorivita lipolytica TaxID=153267 RepID=A0A5C6YKW4_9FLAO|nr:hypothetical protein [Aequorivita lipolytica]TXD67845.1 hypothetical protein ESV24_14835 [Aequorivita lipolytica]SRX54009.1 hypothetical protein AEQU2_03034 [Aequorivita lipolytica]
MKKILILIILLSINQSFGQESKIDKLMIAGNEAYQKSNFETAKLNYQSIIKIDPTNKDAIFNLAGVELNIGNTQQACQLLQKSYSLGDFEAYELIEQYCNGLEYSEKMFLFHVDELPKFKYKNHFEPLIVNKKQINPAYIKLLKSEIKNSKKLKRIRGKIYIMINVGIDGELITDIKGNINESEINELTNSLRKMTEYRPAIFQQKNVGLFGGGFALPLNF